MLKSFYLVFIFFLFQPLVAQGVYLDVVINEIAWMGTNASANDEWIELYNATNNSINLEGWILKAEDETPEINLTGEIPAKGFYLSERTDDNTVPATTADLIYKGALGNNGENLKLYDNLGNLIDEVDCSSGWLAGDNLTKQTMERINANWQTSQNAGGTPKAENSKLPESGSRAAEKVAENSSLPVVYPAGIVFNEILPSPEGADETEEWVELYNQNSFEVDLSNWKIKDTEGKTITYAFPNNTKIPALGYLVLKRPETKITLNNTGDGLTLIYPNGETADSVSFGKAITGQSYNKTENDWAWSTNLTPGEKNNILFSKTGQEKSQEKKSEDEPLEIGSLSGAKAAIGEKLSQPSNLLFVLLIAFVVAVFSAIIILILKKKLRAFRNGE